jgi:hypothetical protein
MKPKKEGLGGTCSTHGGDDKCIHNFSWKTRMEETGYEDVWTGLIWHRIGSSGRLLCVELVVCRSNSCMEHVFQVSIPKFHLCSH